MPIKAGATGDTHPADAQTMAAVVNPEMASSRRCKITPSLPRKADPLIICAANRVRDHCEYWSEILA